MESHTGPGGLPNTSGPNSPLVDGSHEGESRDDTQQGVDGFAAAPGTTHGLAPPSPATAGDRRSRSHSPEPDPPPPYDSLVVGGRQPSQRRSLPGPPPSYASAYSLEQKAATSLAQDPGGEGEPTPPRRVRKRPCVTLNMEEALAAAKEPWASLGPGQGASPCPSLQQQEGSVTDFKSNGSNNNVFFYVQDETEDEVPPTGEAGIKGCDNLGFVADEAEGSPVAGFVPPARAPPRPRGRASVGAPPRALTTDTPASSSAQATLLARSNSNPDFFTPPGHGLCHAHSFTAAPAHTHVHASSTLRKRSTSRGRPSVGPADAPGNVQVKETSFTGGGGDKTPRQATLAVEDSPGLLRKIFSSSFLGLSRSPSTKSCRSVRDDVSGRHSRTPSGQSRTTQGPPSVREESHRHYIMHQHLYRNSRRNVQEKLHRQLSESDHSHHHHGHRRHDSPDGHGHGRAHHHHHHHHHRSQSQRSPARPRRHEPLRRHNTYGHEHYLKLGQELEERCMREDSLEREEEEEEDGEEENPVRRVSHYQQEEKGLTDVERWVGVHGGGSEEGAEPTATTPMAAAMPTTPTTPHIIVSTEEDEGAGTSTQKARPTLEFSEDQCDSSASNGQVTNNGAATAPVIGGPLTEEKRPKLSLTMNSLDLPDARHPSLDFTTYRKTRRNSMQEIMKRVGSSQTNLPPLHPGHNIRRSSSRNSLEPSVVDWRQEGNDSLIACVSALYGKLLVVMGMAFPIAEVISHDIPISFYNGFYLYLYVGSILFLVYAYVFLLQTINIPTSQLKSKFQTLRSYVPMPDLNTVLPLRKSSTSNTKGTGRLNASKDSRYPGDIDKESDRASINTMSFKPPKYGLADDNHGSMYLKMGAVLFGIGSMIYSGLEVGQYFELQADDSCADILLVISPAARMLFTFIQMYFIFLNSRVAISRHRVIARFGLMHMIGTNLCIWLNVLVQETKHEIINLRFGHGGHHGGNLWAVILDEVRGTNLTGHHREGHGDSAVLGDHGHGSSHGHGGGTHGGHHGHDAVAHVTHAPLNDTHNDHDSHEVDEVYNSSYPHAEALVSHGETDHGHGGHGGQAFSIYECSRSELMGELVDNASPFLFPCTIEYSLLCAGVLYVVWNNINKPEVACDGDSDISTYVARKARHHYSVDCAHANRGLFMGILMLVLTIISLILFFVLINNEAYKSLAIMEANIIELSVYSVATVTVVVGMIQMRELEFVPEGDIELDNILLLIAQTGVYIYTCFSIIGGHFTMSDRSFMVLPLLSAIITLTQTTLQTIFILDATRRCCYNHDQLERKPGREMVTFLLVCNLAMWAINTFETSRADAHPTQLNFYGIWAWTIISHISMPLAIFYRFHVTVCLCEIWKRSYKLKNEF
ncbi:uncharacterized protein LOC127005808 isoform X2 [Eriocheir sinensis]|uniref:uncharacterized protein LOC127005808 isoform X2 n=1 Tax=Eriocheir sinensis TaxID=95602 RepID=UPI0021C93BA5|nr:uncharacterized protein LOC127005808 isoform X2 [Eriocheir sinensis]